MECAGAKGRFPRIFEVLNQIEPDVDSARSTAIGEAITMGLSSPPRAF
jgi:hypothetical protein